jgi:hypothetical protein
MELPPAAPLISFLIAMFLVVWTGTAWFIALHPRFIWRMLRGGDLPEHGPAESFRMLRLGGICLGSAGLLLLFLADWFA